MARVARLLLAAAATLVVLASTANSISAVRARSARLHLTPDGQVSDLYPRWLGTHNLLLNGTNPYTPEATREYERGFYGRERDAAEAKLDVTGFQGYNYPLYLAVLMAPLSLLPFGVVKVGAAIALALGLIWSTVVWSRLVGWPRARRDRIAIVLLVLLTLPALDLLSLQQLTGVLIPAIVMIAVALQGGSDLAAGILLAVTMIKPQVTGLLVFGLFAWALRDWRRRWRLLAGFGGTLALLLAAAFALLPDWPWWFLAQAQQYGGTNVLVSPLIALVPSQPLKIVAGSVVVAMSVLAFLREPTAEMPQHQFVFDTIALSVASTLLLLPTAATYNDTLLIFPALVVGRTWSVQHVGVARVFARLALVMGVALIVLSALEFAAFLARLPVDFVTQDQLISAGFIILPLPVWLALVAQQFAGQTSEELAFSRQQ